MFTYIRDLYHFIINIFTFFFGRKWYIIEGNIGCGKTTLIRGLKANADLEVIEEPVEVWKSIRDENGENILGLFYKESKRYSYIFQTIVFKTRIMALEKPQEKWVRFSERSIWTDKNIFSKNCHEIGFMKDIEKTTYDLWFNWLEAKICRKPDGIIYLRAEPNICLERMHKRDRVEESTVSLEYLTTIHNKHDDWLAKRADYNGVPIYVIDNTSEPSTALERVCEITRFDSKWASYMNYIIGRYNIIKTMVNKKLY
jgi:deoxyadenosine/deoxycytidine kinase